jgi:hypothetical protein
VTTEVQTYSNELLLALRMRAVPGPLIAEALAEVHSHVAETGEDPREAFGPPKAYADDLRAALGDIGNPIPLWRGVLSWRTAAYGIGGAAGAWLSMDGALALSFSERGPLGLPAAFALLVGLVVLIALTAGLVRLTRRNNDKVLDPRTGADMTPPLPRWVLPVMVSPPLVGLVLAAVVGLVER